MRIRKSSEELVLTLPSLAWLTAFFFIPTIIVFSFAFKPYDFLSGMGSGWTLDQVNSLISGHSVTIIVRTVQLSLATTAISLLLALPMAYYIARSAPSVRQLLLLLTILPFWSSFIVRIFAWKSLLHPEGLVKKGLLLLHLVSPETTLLYRPAAVVWVMVYCMLPFAILPIYAAIVRFDFGLLEAASDLGMTPMQSLRKVFLPGIRRGIVAAILMVFIPTLGAYVVPEIVGGAESEMIGNKIVQRTFTDRNLPQASAYSLVLALGTLLPLAAAALLRLGQSRSDIR